MKVDVLGCNFNSDCKKF